jgi:hypothetical protein
MSGDLQLWQGTGLLSVPFATRFNLLLFIYLVFNLTTGIHAKEQQEPYKITCKIEMTEQFINLDPKTSTLAYIRISNASGEVFRVDITKTLDQEIKRSSKVNKESAVPVSLIRKIPEIAYRGDENLILQVILNQQGASEKNEWEWVAGQEFTMEDLWSKPRIFKFHEGDFRPNDQNPEVANTTPSSISINLEVEKLVEVSFPRAFINQLKTLAGNKGDLQIKVPDHLESLLEGKEKTIQSVENYLEQIHISNGDDRFIRIDSNVYNIALKKVDLDYKQYQSYVLTSPGGKTIQLSSETPLYQWTVDHCMTKRSDSDQPVALLVQKDKAGALTKLYDLSRPFDSEDSASNGNQPAELSWGSFDRLEEKDLVESTAIKFLLKPRRENRSQWWQAKFEQSILKPEKRNGRFYLPTPTGNFKVMDYFDVVVDDGASGNLVVAEFDRQSNRLQAKLAIDFPKIEAFQRSDKVEKYLASDDWLLLHKDGVLSKPDDSISMKEIVKSTLLGENLTVLSSFNKPLKVQPKVKDKKFRIDLTEAEPRLMRFKCEASGRPVQPAAGWKISTGSGVSPILSSQGAISLANVEELLRGSQQVTLIPPTNNPDFDQCRINIPEIDKFDKSGMDMEVKFSLAYAQVKADASLIGKYLPEFVVRTKSQGGADATVLRSAGKNSDIALGGGAGKSWSRKGIGGSWIPEPSIASFKVAELDSVEPIGLHSQRLTTITSENRSLLVKAFVNSKVSDWDSLLDDAAGIDIYLGEGDSGKFSVKIGNEFFDLRESVYLPSLLGRSFSPIEIEKIQLGEGFLLKNGQAIRKLELSQFLDSRDLATAGPVREQVLHVVLVHNGGTYKTLNKIWALLRSEIASILPHEAESAKTGFSVNVSVVTHTQKKVSSIEIVSGIVVKPGMTAEALYKKLPAAVPTTVGDGEIKDPLATTLRIVSEGRDVASNDDRVLIVAPEMKVVHNGAPVVPFGWNTVQTGQFVPGGVLDKVIEVEGRFPESQPFDRKELEKISEELKKILAELMN